MTMEGPRLIFDYYEVQLLDAQGRGGFGLVYKGKHKETGTAVAVKKIAMEDEEETTWALREAYILQNIKPHKNIVLMLQQEYHNKHLWLVFEYCKHGSLDMYMKKHKIDDATKCTIMVQCAKGLHHLHTNDPCIVHRDIKPGNILITRQNETTIAKISDFGFAKHGDIQQGIAQLQLETYCVTPGFEPPEMHNTIRDYDFTVDIFSLGMVFLAMIQYGGSGDMKPHSETTRASHGNTTAFLSIGQEMHRRRSRPTNMPEFAKVERDDSENIKQLKLLIQNMCAFASRNRKRLPDVIKEINDIQGVSGNGNASREADSGTYTAEDLRVRVSKQVMTESYLSLSRTYGSFSAQEDDERDFMEKTMAEQMSALNGLGLDTVFKVGEKVRVNANVEEFKKQQKSLWCSDMEKAVGEDGTITGSISAEIVLVEMDDTHSEIMMHVSSLKKKQLMNTGILNFNKSTTTGAFKKRDIVRIKDRDTLADFESTMSIKPTLEKCVGVKGFVVDVGLTGVEVHFINGTRVLCKPETLELVSAEEQEGLLCETADIVLVDSNEKLVKKSQTETMGCWDKSLTKVLGKPGLVKEMAENNLVLVEFSTEDIKETYCLSKHVLRVLAKSGEWLMALMDRQDK